MAVTLTAPGWLALAAGALVALLAMLHLSRHHSRRWRWVCLILPGSAIVAVAIALAGPQFHRSPSARSVVILLDLSPSAITSPWTSPAWLRSFLSEHLDPATRATIVGFSEGPQVLLRDAPLSSPAGWPALWPPVRGDSTNLAAAIAWTEGPHDRRPRWLITDGLTELTALQALAAKHELAITRAPPPAADIGIADLQLQFPSGAASDNPRGPEIRTRISATGAIAARVEFRRSGSVFAETRVAFDAASTRVLAVTDPNPTADEAVRYDIIVAPDTRDPWPENNTAAILTPPRGPGRVLLVGRDPAVGTAFASERTTVTAPAGVPATLGRLMDYQLVILADTPAAALPPGAADTLNRFVRDTGGGLLLIGSTSAFGPGNYPGTPLEALSPLASAPPQRPPLNVVFVLDASGSMAQPVRGNVKFKYVLDGVSSAMSYLREEDRVTAVVFGRNVRTLASGPRGKTAEQILNTMRSIRPDGPTNPDLTLPAFEGELDAQSLVILLTDGEIPQMDIPRWARLLASAKAKLTLVAPRDAASPTLEDLCKQTSATWLATDDPTRWPELLRRAVEEPVLGKAMTMPLPWRGVDIGPVSGTTSGWIRTWNKPESTLRAQGTRAADIPLAAVARRGLGQVAAVAMSDSGDDFAGLLRTLAAEVAPPPGDRRWNATARRENGRWLLLARGHEEARFLSGETLHAEIVTDANNAPLPVPLEPVGPGAYEARLPPDVGVFRAVVTRREEGAASLIARLAPPTLPSTEWPASAAAGEVPPIAAQRIDIAEAMPTFWRPRDRGARHDLSAALWLAAATALLGSLWLRRGAR